MRFRVVFVVVLLFCVIVMGTQIFGTKNPVMSEETLTAVKSVAKPSVVKKILFIAQQREEVSEEVNWNNVHIVQSTPCTTTPKQQEVLKELGLDPCAMAQIKVR